MKLFDYIWGVALIALMVAVCTVLTVGKNAQYNELGRAVQRELRIAMQNPEFAQLMREGQ